jgi:D-inositol-3-phosphate glycosyltransferase
VKKLLWVGDAGVPSGFARATHETLEILRRTYDVTVLGINYRGDPHSYPYPIYSCMPGGDWMGIGRLIWMCDIVKPDVIVIQQDAWNFPQYLQQLARIAEYKDIPVVGVVAIDGKNCNGKNLQGLAHAIFWTQFALDEARIGGYEGPASVIPLGVDLSTYKPMDKAEARRSRGLDILNKNGNRVIPESAFIIGNVNRNQPRKRWDLTVKYFADWVTKYGIDDAFLFLHTAPTGDTGCDVRQLMEYYSILPRLILVEPPAWYGPSDQEMCETYNCFDVAITTTQGEGMGLTALEAMACQVPVLAPDWAALGDWAKGAARLVPCTSTAIGPPYLNVIGGVVDQDLFVTELQRFYRSREYRNEVALGCLARAQESRFDWNNIGAEFTTTLAGVLDGVCV